MRARAPRRPRLWLTPVLLAFALLAWVTIAATAHAAPGPTEHDAVIWHHDDDGSVTCIGSWWPKDGRWLWGCTNEAEESVGFMIKGYAKGKKLKNIKKAYDEARAEQDESGEPDEGEAHDGAGNCGVVTPSGSEDLTSTWTPTLTPEAYGHSLSESGSDYHDQRGTTPHPYAR